MISWRERVKKEFAVEVENALQEFYYNTQVMQTRLNQYLDLCLKKGVTCLFFSMSLHCFDSSIDFQFI